MGGQGLRRWVRMVYEEVRVVKKRICTPLMLLRGFEWRASSFLESHGSPSDGLQSEKSLSKKFFFKKKEEN